MNLNRLLSAEEIVAPTELPAWTVDGWTPAMACRPATVEGVAAALQAAASERLAVAPLGGGTQRQWGGRLERLDLVVSLDRLDRIVEYEPADLTVTAEAGISLDRLGTELARHRQYLPLDPALPPNATIGGILATGASGSLRFGHGTARDLVLGARFVLADGTIARTGGRVVKNVAGYDLAKLLIGSFGTLGVVVAVSLKVAPLPAGWQTLVGHVADADAAQGIVLAAIARGLPFRALDVAEGLGDGRYAIVARAGGTPDTLARIDREFTAVAREGGAVAVERLDGDGEAALWQAIRRPAPPEAVVTRAIALPSQLGGLLAMIEQMGKSHRWAGSSRAHGGNGVLRTTWLDAGGGVAGLADLVGVLRSQIGKIGGWLVVESCPPSLKVGLDVWGSLGDQLRPMQAIKSQFDPAGILNPGRYPL